MEGRWDGINYPAPGEEVDFSISRESYKDSDGKIPVMRLDPEPNWCEGCSNFVDRCWCDVPIPVYVEE